MRAWHASLLGRTSEALLQAMDPAWQKYSEDSKGVVVAEVNCDDEKALCEAYAVSSYPTMIYIHDKKIYKVCVRA